MRRGALRWATGLGVVLVVAALLPGYLRAYTISGDSDAPAYVTGDRVLVNLAAYDIRIPYSTRVLATVGEPRPGEMVLFRGDDGELAVKRVVAGPGTRVEMRNNHLIVDGRPLHYQIISEQPGIFRGSLGTTLELETGNGYHVHVSYTPGLGEYHSFEPLDVPEDMFFLLGSNRDVSLDSRGYGPIHRSRILGKVVRVL